MKKKCINCTYFIICKDSSEKIENCDKFKKTKTEVEIKNEK